MAGLLFALLALACGLALAPLQIGVINRVKAKVGGRHGRPLLQLYWDIAKLWRKRPVYSQTTGPLFRFGPVAAAATALCALTLLPFGGYPALFSFNGDFLLLGGLFALGRFATMLAALDTGSAFEGMGTVREALFSALAEPVFIFCMAVLAYASGELSLAAMLRHAALADWTNIRSFHLLLGGAFFLLLLTENSRIPVDDPNTHLELTMIHEVMVLDHSGPDLALIEYGAALKLWLFSLLITALFLPLTPAPFFTPDGSVARLGPALLNAGLTVLFVFFLSALVGLVESAMARLRMERVPLVLVFAGAFACLAALSVWR